MSVQSVIPWVPMLPLAAALLAGFGGRRIGDAGAHCAAIFGVGASFALSAYVAAEILSGGGAAEFDWYVWSQVGDLRFTAGFLVDGLAAVMMVVVTFVSLMVHIYTMRYMRGDPGYRRFFCYTALFTFAMLMLVMSNNFLQLFFGWEAVGLVSYLLIGFWHARPTAVRANLKAFLVNRVGDFGFLVGIGLVLAHFGTLDYGEVFAASGSLAGAQVELVPGYQWSTATVICVALFIGAMGKSAQIPLHVWLPDSMEGPTPISALIHAATMVTAGIFMVARMSPLFELSETALTLVLAVGAATAFLMALVGLVQNDIKRVVAYSTISQLGYMTAALGASAYAASIFHLATHAFFKALLFLCAGSVIIALHHEQDMRRMGGLARKMPVTFATAVVGTLALSGLPPFAGFFSKDAIIIAVGASSLPGAQLASWLLVAGAFVTAFYSFRLLAMVFLGSTPIVGGGSEDATESPWQITLPLIALALMSAVSGWLLLGPMLLDGGWLAGALAVSPGHDTLAGMRDETPDALAMVAHSFSSPVLLVSLAGAAVALLMYVVFPWAPAAVAGALRPLHLLLLAKYGFDEFNERVLARATRGMANFMWKRVDDASIDGAINGAAGFVATAARGLRRLQTGRIYDYAFVMMACLAAFAAWFLRG